jgi:hypothetical protein
MVLLSLLAMISRMPGTHAQRSLLSLGSRTKKPQTSSSSNNKRNKSSTTTAQAGENDINDAMPFVGRYIARKDQSHDKDGKIDSSVWILSALTATLIYALYACDPTVYNKNKSLNETEEESSRAKSPFIETGDSAKSSEDGCE